MAANRYVYMAPYRFELTPKEKRDVSGLFDIVTDKDLDSDASLASKVEGIIVPANQSSVARTKQWIPKFPQLKAITSTAAGYHLIYSELKGFGIPIANCPGAHTDAVADHTMSLLLAAGCGLLTELRATILSEKPHELPRDYRSSGISQMTLGIVGLGRIGSAVARRAQAFDMRVLYHGRRRNTEDEERQAGVVHYCESLEKLLPQCDFVAVACSLNDQTWGMFSGPQFEMMKQSATFVNVARGQVVDTGALVKALMTGQIRQAALDVTDPEPLPPEHPLLRLDNVIITPHIAMATSRGLTRCMSTIANNLRAAIIDGKKMPNEVMD